MSDETAASSVLAYLRMPVFGPSNKRSPRSAILRALPAWLLIAGNLWLCTFFPCWLVTAYFGLPTFFMVALMVLVAVPITPVTWAILVRCIEVEAELES